MSFVGSLTLTPAADQTLWRAFSCPGGGQAVRRAAYARGGGGVVANGTRFVYNEQWSFVSKRCFQVVVAFL